MTLQMFLWAIPVLSLQHLYHEEALTRLYADHPDATIVAGATDVGLWITKQLRTLPKIIHVGRTKGLDKIIDQGTHISIGATATYPDAEVASRLD